MTPLRPGDIVRLRSGGPPMTVHHTVPDPKQQVVQVSWFVDGHWLKHGILPVAQLERVPDEPDPAPVMEDDENDFRR